MGAVTLAVAAPGLWQTSSSNGTPVVSVRPTGAAPRLAGLPDEERDAHRTELVIMHVHRAATSGDAAAASSE